VVGREGDAVVRFDYKTTHFFSSVGYVLLIYYGVFQGGSRSDIFNRSAAENENSILTSQNESYTKEYRNFAVIR